MMTRRPVFCALVLLAAGCAHPAPHAAPAPDGEPLAPLVDYHQHLASPAGAALLNARRIPAPAVDVPEEIAVLLRQRAERWNDSAGLAELYTPRSMVLGFDSDWVRGRDAVAGNASHRFGRPLRLTPIAHGLLGDNAWVTGYFTRGEGDAARHFGLFHLALERDGGGAWRIAVETPTFPGPEVQDPITAEQLVARLDEAGIRRAVVLSDAYWFDSPRNNVTSELAKVRAENDWTAQQVARFPDRLVAFCSFNPLREHALAELERCAADGRFRGVKLHFGMSGVDLRDPGQVAKVRQVFQAANRLKLAIITHVRADAGYGREHAEVLLNQLVAAAPDVPVQIALGARAGVLRRGGGRRPPRHAQPVLRRGGPGAGDRRGPADAGGARRAHPADRPGAHPLRLRRRGPRPSLPARGVACVSRRRAADRRGVPGDRGQRGAVPALSGAPPSRVLSRSQRREPPR
jgi:predicted TIM-barrel fold metal-dependent hydrolase